MAQEARPSYIEMFCQDIAETGAEGGGGGEGGGESSGPSEVTVDVDHNIMETNSGGGGGGGGRRRQSSGPSYVTVDMNHDITETGSGGGGGGGGRESSGPLDVTVDVNHDITETGSGGGGRFGGGGGRESSGPSDVTVDVDHDITETGSGGGGTESSGPSDVTVEVDHEITEIGSGGGGRGGVGRESIGTEAQANTIIVIPKVPKQLSVIDENSYTPHYVPIGPYHVRYSSSEITQEKQTIVNYYLRRLSEQQQEGGGLTDLAGGLARQVRACYPRIGHMTTEQWSTMLMRDGCYLLGYMVGVNNDQAVNGVHTSNNVVVVGSTPAVNDQESPLVRYPKSSGIKWSWIKSCFFTSDHEAPASSNNTAASTPTENDDQETSEHNNVNRNNTVVRDTVFLVDNQIPFFVLQRIHERVTGDTTSSVLEPIAVYVQELLQVQLYISKHRRPAPTTPPSHLLHLLHTYLQPTSPPPQAAKKKSRRTGRWLRATEYCKYGNVWIKPRDFEDHQEWTFLDVHLQGSTLWIPPLRVDNMTWTVLRNLMAFEQPRLRKPVTSYCVFMSQVAGTVEDVELLQRQEILEQFLVNNEEVAKGFANLCKGVVLDIDNGKNNYLKPLWHQLRSLCTYKRHCLGSFRQKNCSDPIYQVAFVIAILVFLIQLAQVILPLPKVQKHL